MPKITKRLVDGLEPAARTRIEWDSEVKGFGVRITPGGVLAFVLRYRNSAGRDRTHTIGRYGVLTVDQAREQARALLVAIRRDGADPVAEGEAHRTGADVGELLDRYLAEHVAIRNKATTETEVRRLVERNIRPAIGRLKVADVKRADIERLHRSFRETPRTANLILSALSKAFTLAETWGLRPEGLNPCRKIERFPEAHRERHLSAAELARLGQVMREAAESGLPWAVVAKGPEAKHLAKPENRRSPVNLDALAVLRFLLLSGSRLSEALELRWDHIDAKAVTVALPGRKGGPRRAHPVSAAAMAVVIDQPRIHGVPWVFPAPTEPSPGQTRKHLGKSVVEHLWQRLRAHAGLPDVRIHDLRHTVGTAAGRLGANAFLVRDMLRHSNVTMTHRYVNRDVDPLRDLSNRIGNELSASLDSRSSADVVPLPQKGRVRRGSKSERGQKT